MHPRAWGRDLLSAGDPTLNGRTAIFFVEQLSSGYGTRATQAEKWLLWRCAAKVSPAMCLLCSPPPPLLILHRSIWLSPTRRQERVALLALCATLPIFTLDREVSSPALACR